jgi:hypothetical protein
MALAVTGAADNISVAIRQARVQMATPKEMRGRLSALSSIFIGASNQLGEFESGATATLFGAGGIGASRWRPAARLIRRNQPRLTAARMPCISASGVGGQPGTRTSTATTLSTAPQLA